MRLLGAIALTGLLVGGVVAVEGAIKHEADRYSAPVTESLPRDLVHLQHGQPYNVATGIDMVTGLPACRIAPVRPAQQAEWTRHTGVVAIIGYDEALNGRLINDGVAHADNPAAAKSLCDQGFRYTPGQFGTYFIE